MIFRRRAVRKYDKSPLDSKTIQKIKDFLAAQKQLDGTHARFEFVTSAEVSDGKAPHYILAYAEKITAEYINVGYTLQSADLFIQSLGLGSVWLGMPSPKEKTAKENFCIMLGFGRTDEKERTSEAEFRRLPLSQISNEKNSIAAAARLAPSAINMQPWYLNFSESGLTVESHGRGLLKNLIRNMNKIDLGIVCRHIVLAAENEGRKIKSVIPTDDGKKFFVQILFDSEEKGI